MDKKHIKDKEAINKKQNNDNFLDKIFNYNKTQNNNMSEAENVSLIIKEWLSPKHVERKTRYNKRQVRAVSTLQSLANTYKIKTLKRYLDTFRTVKLSEEGATSKELKEILISRIPEMQETKLEKLSKYLE